MSAFLTLLLLLCLGAGVAGAEEYSAPSVAILLYSRDSKGFYTSQTNVPVTVMEKSAVCYAYDKKNKQLYLSTNYGNFVVKVNDDVAKQVKKDKNIPQMSGAELNAKVQAVNRQLDERFERLNQERRTFIADSIAAVREKERLAAIERARQDSIRKAQRQEALKRYRATHSWRWLPVNVSKLRCDLCDESVSVRDSVFVVAVKTDSIYFLGSETGLLGNEVLQVHVSAIPSSLNGFEGFSTHVQAFKDSLETVAYFNREMVGELNLGFNKKYVDALSAQAPYGFFLEWDWNDSYSMVTFDFTFLNMNKKTIKYIDVYWKISNDVGDVRKTGHFKGTGPVEQYDSGSWSWDSSSYFVAGDATTMELTKVIITYMNGSQQTLTKKMIFTETDYRD